MQVPGIIGESLSSSAAYDPIFWPLHGQIERLLGLKRINKILGLTILDERWAYDYNYDATSLIGVCDWSNVKDASDLALPQCNASMLCYGHGENDIVDYIYEVPSSEETLLTFTNMEFFNWIHPMNDFLPYVFDTYQFSYCNDENGGYVGSDNHPTDEVIRDKQGMRMQYMPAHRDDIKNRERI